MSKTVNLLGFFFLVSFIVLVVDRLKFIFLLPSGGISEPTNCESRQQLAIIIPFRNREYHLKLLLKYLHPFLQRQKRSYQVFVVEQVKRNRIRRQRKSSVQMSSFHSR